MKSFMVLVGTTPHVWMVLHYINSDSWKIKETFELSNFIIVLKYEELRLLNQFDEFTTPSPSPPQTILLLLQSDLIIHLLRQ